MKTPLQLKYISNNSRHLTSPGLPKQLQLFSIPAQEFFLVIFSSKLPVNKGIENILPKRVFGKVRKLRCKQLDPISFQHLLFKCFSFELCKDSVAVRCRREI